MGETRFCRRIFFFFANTFFGGDKRRDGGKGFIFVRELNHLNSLLGTIRDITSQLGSTEETGNMFIDPVKACEKQIILREEKHRAVMDTTGTKIARIERNLHS